jgi:hypothetical protein
VDPAVDAGLKVAFPTAVRANRVRSSGLFGDFFIGYL